MDHLGTHFGIPVSTVHRIIHKILPILHAVTVPKYIKWHTFHKWNTLVGEIPEWPNVVAIIDGTHLGSVDQQVDSSCTFIIEKNN